ncbi:hypothetical protein SAZ10_00485 [Mesorhizobium sp. BAC0120]|uniref:hypothetical protein n=1 Tax=Mesorhizobium sp. BAC0120 TaxID=3090670 RepID=UPI00298BE260|nr:hypothetical protein [Mesorhizobium sp. BAC0120]MDW6020232.1 hypothetical protein [Mesorhizobium sp. BAC0120]
MPEPIPERFGRAAANKDRPRGRFSIGGILPEQTTERGADPGAPMPAAQTAIPPLLKIVQGSWPHDRSKESLI